MGRACSYLLPRVATATTNDCSSAANIGIQMPALGRVREVTNGCFVEAEQEKRWLCVRLLWSSPAGRYGSELNDRSGELTAWNLSFAMLKQVRRCSHSKVPAIYSRLRQAASVG